MNKKTSTTQSFNLLRIHTPSFNAGFTQDPGPDSPFNQGFRVYVNILTDTRVRVSFGINLESVKTIQDAPMVYCSVDTLAELEFQSPLPQKMKELSDVPLMANILAMLYPFLREKVNYFFSNNYLLVLLPPVNTFEIIKGLASLPDAGVLVDERISEKNKKMAE